MNKTLKTKIRCMLLILVMLFSMTPVTVFADAAADTGTENPAEEGTDVGAEDDVTDDGEIDYSDAVAVTSADELEAALGNAVDAVRIAADFELDRTFYVTSSVVIVADEAHTLTRASGFGGDIFVISLPETEEGEDESEAKSVVLTLGKPDDSTASLITIDGNAANMTADVVGTVILVGQGTRADLMKNLTVKNAVKIGNERLLDSDKVSYPARVGGAVAILEKGSTMNIYGGSYTDNAVNDITDSSTDEGSISGQGGAIYNYGTLNIYGGSFLRNHAGRGGAFYNYRTMNIYNAVISENTASTLGGAIYVPASTAAYLYIGEENDTVESDVTFSYNVADSNGGAIYAQHVMTVRNADFIGNSSSAGHGGAIAASGIELSLDYTVFDGNSAVGGYGGALYITGSVDDEDARELTVGKSSFSSNSSKRGGAVYISGGARTYFSNTDFVSNTSAGYAGVIYVTASTLEINGASIKDNSATSHGGAVYLTSAATATLNNVVATDNTTATSGGVVYATAEGTSVTVYNSTLKGNSATDGSAGAVYAYTGSTLNAYNTVFEANTATVNGGALFLYTGEVASVLHSCKFISNHADELGGGMYVSGKTQGEFYNLTANGNDASKGGFMYHTAAGTNVTLVGLELLGNTATVGGPIIWGNTTNAKLYIDKLKYVDNGHDGDWDDAYWEYAIYNLLTVYEITGTIPAYEDYGTGELIQPEPPVMATDVATAAQLERALEVGYSLIRITADFEIDRTFFVWASTTIFTAVGHTLTRAADFGGDIFVVGMDPDGNRAEDEVVLTLCKADGTDATLTVDGNSGNMTVDVVGTVILVCKGSRADLCGNLVIANNTKVGNDRILSGFSVSYPARVGGAVAILETGSVMNIYGGSYTNNKTNDITDANTDEGSISSHGGAFYNHGELNIYGGLFSGNHAGRGGAFYNYRQLHIYSADIEANTASTFGGAIYMPNSTGAFLYVGEETDVIENGSVTFRGNSAAGGGALYARNYIYIKGAVFEGNIATDSNYGGAIYAGSTRMALEGVTFKANSSTKYGGAIYITGSNEREDVLELVIKDSVFDGNSAPTRAGAIYASAGARLYISGTEIKNNSSDTGGVFYLNGASLEMNDCVITDNTSVGPGAVIYALSSSTVRANALTVTGNSATGHAGFAYLSATTLELYNSTVSQNSSESSGGAVYATTDSVLGLYSTRFEKNTAAVNGGALFIYTAGTSSVIHSCTFIDNTGASLGGVAYISNKSIVDIYNITAADNNADKGGFLYITTTGTVVTAGGVTVSGNSAVTGGPIIWGNSTGAKLYIDMSKYTDTDHSGAYDDAYWSAAIYNKLTYADTSVDIPKYLDYGNEAYDHMSDAVDVSSADELEAAILSGAKHIRIVADFEIDRTFYIVGNVTIFSTIGRTLTRAPGFGGDMFVVGEDASGMSSILMGYNSRLTLGNPLSTKEDLLVINGNAENMTVDVVGSVIFIANSATVDLYTNLTVTNCRKVGNERTENEKYQLGIPNRIGGTLAVVASGTLNIYGGNYTNNWINEEFINGDDESGRNSTAGGLIFNYSNLYIYGGRFEGNVGARGGVIYNYRVARIYGGSFIGNTATVAGGVYYAPNSAQVHLYIGKTGAELGTVLFEGNTAKSAGGVIYASTLSANVIYGGASFVANSSTESSGGAIAMYGQLTVRGSSFVGNTAASRGGAIYASKSALESTTRHIEITDCTFESNVGTLGGAISLYASSAEFPEGAIASVSRCVFTANAASLEINGASSASGGAIYADRKVSLTVNSSEFYSNTAATEGGAMYISGESSVTVHDSVISGSVSGKHGGAISLRSSYLDITTSAINGSTAKNNGGAIYVSYQSNRDVNSRLGMLNTLLEANACEGSGGAIYATRRDIEDSWDILTVKDSEFNSNSAATHGGALYTVSGLGVYIEDTDFTSNTATADEDSCGGAAYFSGSIVEINGASFTANSASDAGGAIMLGSSATVVANAIVASKNEAKLGAFAYLNSSSLDLYNSEVSENAASASGGAIYAYTGAVMNLYGCSFTSNTAASSAGALFLYTGGGQVLIHSCDFIGNSAVELGGGMYISNKSVVSIYNTTATDNSASRGGFMYETTTGTVVTAAGITVSGNTASDGGSIIWGNSAGAKLYIDKAQYTDLEQTGELDDAYWEGAIYNALTVEELGVTVPEYEDYSREEPEITTPEAKPVVSVDEIFELENTVTDGYINSYYDKFPKLDSSSNFMSDGVTVFENINGGTVTVDSFVYNTYAPDGNTNFGQGMLIYQAMLYKKAHPEENVSIDISSYRFSVESAININRDSRYFGYMRNLGSSEYDSLGFVRIAYLLVSAAKMGINVNVIGHIDAYPVSSGAPNLYDYFTGHLDTPCDPAYASGTVGSYLDFNQCYWSLLEKGGTDMMHTKLCAVSHYVDMNGVEHKNAVWTSSANLDGITNKGYNGNWKLQTATIVSDHESIYRVSTNYLRLIADYCSQEGIYEFQDIMSIRSAEQLQLLLAGRGEEIAPEDQLVYIGSETDDVFELYFTPFAGSTAVWDEVNNPYCKYIREMYNSEDSIIFVWNAAEYNSSFTLGSLMEEMIVGAFVENKSLDNKFFGNMEHFDASRLDVLTEGVDIGYISLNEYPFGAVHNKDILMSYVKDGVRYYTSLLNSCNMHSGSMYYQSNFMLVIKETELTEDSVFFTMADLSTTGIVEHTYGEEQPYLPEDGSHGYYYRPCLYCDKQIITGSIHRESEWIVDREAAVGENGIKHKECTVCGTLLETMELVVGEVELESSYESTSGTAFTSDPKSFIDVGVSGRILTLEALIQLSPDISTRGGVIVGNYDFINDNLLNLEVYNDGKLRLYYKVGGVGYSYLFSADIRSEQLKHIAVTVDGRVASLYIDGVFSESLSLGADIPESVSGLKVGGDNRSWQPPYFKGRIYSVSLFSDVRTAAEIMKDAVSVPADTDALLYSRSYSSPTSDGGRIEHSGVSFDGTDAISTGALSGEVKTFEAIISLPVGHADRGGVVIGNYDGSDASGINIEIYTDGAPRLYYKVGGVGYSHVFSYDMRCGSPVHIAIVLDGLTASLYVDGSLTEVAELTKAIPAVDDTFNIGNDMREGSAQYFKGVIYAVGLYSEARTAAEIARDAVLMSHGEDTLYLSYLNRQIEEEYVGGGSFTSDTSVKLDTPVAATPHTLEALIRVPVGMTERVGVIFGNYYDSYGDAINFEIYDNGRPRLYMRSREGAVWCTFSTSINSDKPVHIAIVIKSTEALLYVDGILAEVQHISIAAPEVTEDFVVGGDNRYGNSQYFKAELYSIHVFSDARSAEEIASDAVSVSRYAQDLIYSESFAVTDRTETDGFYTPAGQTFDGVSKHTLTDIIGTPATLEALIQLSPEISGRGGVLIGNYTGGAEDQINLEIYSEGRVRLFFIAGGERVDCLFSTDIRSDSLVHIAVTVDGTKASLYVNGSLAEERSLSRALPAALRDMIVGGDYRLDNTNYFKGKIYSLALFSEVRGAEQIRRDVSFVAQDTDGLMASVLYGAGCCTVGAASGTHIKSEWIVDREATAEHNGVKHIECLVCGKILSVREITNTAGEGEHIVFDDSEALSLESSNDAISVGALASAPLTLEFLFTLSVADSERGGVLFGNYDGTDAAGMNVEIYTNGAPRLYYKVRGVGYSIIFNTDVRSDKLTHMAITIDGFVASLYVDGALVETVELEVAVPELTEDFNLGNDRRADSAQYFKGKIYSAHVFGDVRSPEEIAEDALKVMDTDSLLYSAYFTK